MKGEEPDILTHILFGLTPDPRTKSDLTSFKTSACSISGKNLAWRILRQLSGESYQLFCFKRTVQRRGRFFEATSQISCHTLGGGCHAEPVESNPVLPYLATSALPTLKPPRPPFSDLLCPVWKPPLSHYPSATAPAPAGTGGSLSRAGAAELSHMCGISTRAASVRYW